VKSLRPSNEATSPVTFVEPPARASDRRADDFDWLWLAAVVGLAVVVQLLFAPGRYGTDDVLYALRGAEISSGIWRPGQNVGEIRYGVSQPIAASIRMLGRNEAALIGWSFLCAVAEVAVVYVVARKAWGTKAAVLSAMLLAMAPLHVILGDLSLADAPLAFFFTVAMASFFHAEQQRSRWAYVVAGIALGLSWWIKPHAMVPFTFVFAAYALVYRTWRREWLLVALAAGAMLAIELLMFRLKFGDALFGLHVLLGGFNRSYVASDSMWGSSSPWFYFRQMFVDGRDLWLLPLLAVGGLWMLTRSRFEARDSWWSRRIAFWAVAMVCVFSFLPIHLQPFKWIPKQENYALMFVAPLALLGGFALSRLPNAWLAAGVAVFAIGACALSALESYRVALHYSSVKQTLDFARAHPDSVVFASSQAVKSAYLDNLLANAVQSSGNLVSVTMRPDADLLLQSPDKERFVVVDPSTPEFLSQSSRDAVQRLIGRCARPVATFVPTANGPAVPVMRALSLVRPRLPGVIDRQLGFVDSLASPPQTTVYGFKPEAVCEN
jgi:4-amino-4-deoxy-L-arabinose transferase-like glycosyltransferase